MTAKVGIIIKFKVKSGKRKVVVFFKYLLSIISLASFKIKKGGLTAFVSLNTGPQITTQRALKIKKERGNRFFFEKALWV
ncbi:MAG: hypothetical protein A2Y82_00530 [Candidatus Buchananbacteria bacterium RBG_13_36_9]|uniref:Uncharacterized protein n=1 Tax=Candidatus Buchananbacteria bacterium RBG_13_36_9 TaxID=1797530 RepID=A0A1G1XQG8_9BACT|nr:MAG: hypothetical protein A2Y82_00530 [Candidatus Buchananbacteria bacterium RBG_13_36_9]